MTSDTLFLSIIILCIAIFFSVIRFISLDDIFTKILTGNLLGTKIVLLILLIDYSNIETNFIDIAMVYALINFISTIVVLRYFQHKEQ